MLTRDETNSFWTRKGNLKGVPITLKVPTHVNLTIFELHYMFAGDGPTRRLKLPFVVRDFSQEFVYNEKIFTVDFKRPAAGLYNLNLDLTDDQYINELQHDITDDTLKQVGALLKDVAPKGFSGFKTVGGHTDAPYEEIKSVVAVGMFEIEHPEFEEQMMAFINWHLNQAHDAWVAPPGIGPMHRVRLSDDQPPLHVETRPTVQHAIGGPPKNNAAPQPHNLETPVPYHPLPHPTASNVGR